MQVAKRLNAVGIVTPLHKPKEEKKPSTSPVMHGFDALIYGTIPSGAEHTKVKRATSPTARFFHVQNSQVRDVPAFMVTGGSVRTVRPHAQLTLCFQLPSTRCV